MARTDNLTNFLTDIATAIKQKTGDSTAIPASEFDTEIASIETAGTYQQKSLNISTNGTQVVTPDTGYDAISQLTVTTSVPSDVKLFATQADMQADPNPQEGDLAVVYRNDMAPPSPGDTISSFSVPSTVVFDTPITSSASLQLVSSNYMVRLSLSLNATNFSIYDQRGTIMPSPVTYTSSDGITYTRTDSGASSYDLNTSVTIPSNANTNILRFLLVGSAYFEGLYEYSSNQYDIAKSQLTATAKNVNSTLFYGKNGVENGTMQNVTNLNKQQLKEKADFYNVLLGWTTNETDLSNCFASDSSLTTIPLLDTSDVTSMSSMFGTCTSLTTIPLLDTGNVTNMSSMFSNCTNLEEIPLLDMSNVETATSMFASCTSLTTIPLLDTSNVTNMATMFGTCTSLTTIPLLDTGNVTNMSSMFSNCTNLEEIPLLDTSSATTMESMFRNCTSLTSIPLLDTGDVTSMSNMFASCTSLTTIPLLDTSDVTNVSSMFNGCTSLTSIPQLDTGNVTNMNSMFYGCSSLTTIPVLGTNSVTNMLNMFKNCTSLNQTSLNNILQMCINATSFTGAKVLKNLGISSAQATTCQGLSNYSAFIAAGWTTGY